MTLVTPRPDFGIEQAGAKENWQSMAAGLSGQLFAPVVGVLQYLAVADRNSKKREQ